MSLNLLSFIEEPLPIRNCPFSDTEKIILTVLRGTARIIHIKEECF